MILAHVADVGTGVSAAEFVIVHWPSYQRETCTASRVTGGNPPPDGMYYCLITVEAGAPTHPWAVFAIHVGRRREHRSLWAPARQ